MGALESRVDFGGVGGGGLAQKEKSPDFRCPEVGISASGLAHDWVRQTAGACRQPILDTVHCLAACCSAGISVLNAGLDPSV